MKSNSSKNAEYDDNKSVARSMRMELTKIKELMRHDNDKKLQTLLDDNPIDVNADLIIEQGPDRSLLTIACTMSAVRCVKVLLDNGADINKIPVSKANSIERDEFRSPFSRTCATGNAELLQMLIDRGVKLDDSVLFIGFDCLEQSDLGNDKRQAIAAVLVQYITNISYKERASTFLHRVCSIGGVDLAKTVLERGVDRDTISDSSYLCNRRDALGVAALNGYLDIVKLLLEWDRNSPIHVDTVNKAMVDAAKQGKLELVQYLTEYGANGQSDALLESLNRTCSFGLVEYLLDHGAEANYVNVDGDTPLITLISNTRSGDEIKLLIARILLARGADRDVTNRSGKHLLVKAAQCGLADFLQLILEHDQGTPITINRLNEALFISLAHSLGTTKCLLDHGAEVNATGADGYTPLMLLCCKSRLGHTASRYFVHYFPTVQLLLERGADVSRVNRVSGDTALLYACDHGLDIGLKLSTMLLEHGADVNQANVITGQTPLMRAALAKDMASVKLYLEHGTDVMQLNGKGLTVLDLMGSKPEYAMYVELCREYGDVKPLLK